MLVESKPEPAPAAGEPGGDVQQSVAQRLGLDAGAGRDGPRPGAVSHEGEVRPMWSGYRWFCSCGSAGSSALGTEYAAEREHFHHAKRQKATKG